MNDTKSYFFRIHTFLGLLILAFLMLVFTSYYNLAIEADDDVLGYAVGMCEEDPDSPIYLFSSANAKEWQSAFYNKLEELEAINGKIGFDDDYNYAGSYFIYDFDFDNTPELCVKYGTAETSYRLEIIKYYQGELKRIYEGGCSHSSFYSIPDGGMIVYYGQNGEWFIFRLNNGNPVTKECIAYFDDGKEYGGNPYPDISTFMDGSEYLSLTSIDNPSAIVFYDSDSYFDTINQYKENNREMIEDAICNNESAYVSIFRSNKSILNKDEMRYINEPFTFSEIFKNNILDYYCSDLTITDACWGDLNGDGQDECLLLLSSGVKNKKRCWAVVSNQNGYYYIYNISYIQGYSGSNIELKKDHIIITYPDGIKDDEDYYIRIYKNLILIAQCKR